MKHSMCMLMLFYSLTATAQKKHPTPVSEIPSLPLYNYAGFSGDLKQLASNKITIIDFWFVPCGACFAEMNMLDKILSTYHSNRNISFLTITTTDSAFARPLTRNINTDSNQTYDYFKTLSGLDSFRLPVYFIPGVSRTQTYFMTSKSGGFSGHQIGKASHPERNPEPAFGFDAYPTLLIYDESGKLIYHHTGFTSAGEAAQLAVIQKVINSRLQTLQMKHAD